MKISGVTLVPFCGEKQGADPISCKPVFSIASKTRKDAAVLAMTFIQNGLSTNVPFSISWGTDDDEGRSVE